MVAPTTPEAVAPTTPAATKVAKDIAEKVEPVEQKPVEPKAAEVKPVEQKQEDTYGDKQFVQSSLKKISPKITPESSNKVANRAVELAKMDKDSDAIHLGHIEQAIDEVGVEVTPDPTPVVKEKKAEPAPKTTATKTAPKPVVSKPVKATPVKAKPKAPSIKNFRSRLRQVAARLKALKPAALNADGTKAKSKKVVKLSDGTSKNRLDARIEYDKLLKEKKQLRSDMRKQSDLEVKRDGVLPANVDPIGRRKLLAPEDVASYEEQSFEDILRGNDKTTALLDEKLPTPALLKKRKQTPPDDYVAFYNSLSPRRKEMLFSDSVTTNSPDGAAGNSGFDNVYDAMNSVAEANSTTSKDTVKDRRDALQKTANEENFKNETETRYAGDEKVYAVDLNEGDVLYINGEATEVVGFSETGNPILETGKAFGEIEVDLGGVLFVEEFQSKTEAEKARAADEADAARTQQQAEQADPDYDNLQLISDRVGAPVTKVAAVGTDQKFSEQVSNALGRRVVFFKTIGTEVDGAMVSNDPSVVYINIDATQPTIQVIGHEIGHTLQEMEGYQEFADAVFKSNPKAYEKWKKNSGVSFKSETLSKQEFIADLVGSRFGSPDFWEKLRSETGDTAFRRFAKFAKNAVEKILSSFRDPKNLRYIPQEAILELDAVDTMLAEMLRKIPEFSDKTLAEVFLYKSEATQARDTAREIAAKRDKEYSELAKDPVKNTPKLQKLVDAAAKAAGYAYKVFHGSKASDIKIFDGTDIPLEDRTDAGRYGEGLIYTSNEGEAKRYGKNLYPLYLKMENPIVIPKGSNLIAELIKLDPSLDGLIRSSDNLRRHVERLGFDGIYEPEATYAGTTKPIYATYDPYNVKSAEPVTYRVAGFPIALHRRFDESSPEIYFSETSKSNKNTQTQSATNGYIKKEKHSVNEVVEYVKEKFNFDPETIPLNAEGAAKARNFLNFATSPKGRAQLQNGLASHNSDFAGTPSAMAIGVASSLYFAYGVKLFSTNPELAVEVINRGQAFANLFTADIFGQMDSSEAGKYLRSFRGVEGGNLMSLFMGRNQGLEKYLARIFSSEDIAKQIMAAEGKLAETELSPEGKQAVEDSVAVVEDVETKRLDEQEAKHFKEVQSALLEVADAVEILIGLGDQFDIQFSKTTESPAEKFVRMVREGKSPSESLGAFKAIDFSQIKGIKKSQVKTIKKKVAKAEDSELGLRTAQGTKFEKKNDSKQSPIDRLSKSQIRKTNNWENPVDKKPNDAKESFDKLMGKVTSPDSGKDPLTREEFTAEFVKLGGDKTLARELYKSAKAEAARKTEEVALAAQKEEFKKNTAEYNKKLIRLKKQQENFDNQLEKLDSTPTDSEVKKASDTANRAVNAATRKSNPISTAELSARLTDLGYSDSQVSTILEKVKAKQDVDKAEAGAEAQLKKDQAELDAKLKENDSADKSVEKLLADTKLAGDPKPKTTSQEINQAYRDATRAKDPISFPELSARLTDLGVSAERIADISVKVSIKRAAAKAKATAEAAVKKSEKDHNAKVNEAERVSKLVETLTSKEAPTPPAKRNPTRIQKIRKAFSEATKLKEPITAAELRARLEALGLSESEISAMITQSADILAGKEAAKAKDKEASQVQAAENSFKYKKRTPAKTRSIRQIIREDFIDNPAMKLETAVDRRKFLDAIIKERHPNLGEAARARVVANTTKAFDKMLTEAMTKTFNDLAKSMKSGKISTDALAKAKRFGILNPENLKKLIALRVANPSKDFATSVATLKGWDGLTVAEMKEVANIQLEIDKLGKESRVSTAKYFKMMKIIRTSSGIPAEGKDWINSFLRANMYSGIGSQLIGVFSGTFAMVNQYKNLMFEATGGLFKENPVLFFRKVGIIHKAYLDNAARALLEAGYAIGTGTSFVSQVNVGDGTELSKAAASGGGLFDGALAAQSRLNGEVIGRAMAEIRAGRNVVKNSAIVAKKLPRYAAGLMDFVFRGLGAVDAGFTKFYSSVEREVATNSQAAREGVSRQDLKVIHDTINSDLESMRNTVNTSNPELSAYGVEVEVRERVEGKIFQATMAKISPEGREALLAVEDAAVKDIQGQLGVGETSKHTFVGMVGDSLARFANYVPVFGPTLFPAIRTATNVADYSIWHMPIFGLVRAFGSTRGKTLADIQKIHPDITSDTVLRRRRTDAVISNVVAALFAGLLKGNDELEDDEKWFYLTGGYPVYDRDERDRWKANSWKPNTLVLGRKGNRLEIQLDRGIGLTMLLPAAMAKVVVPDGASAQDQIANLVGLTFVGFSQVGDNSEGLYRNIGKHGVAGGLGETLLLRPLQNMIPAKGFLATVEKTRTPIERSKSQLNFFQKIYSPVYIGRNGDNIFESMNFLGETVAHKKNTVGNALTRLGVPMYFEWSEKSRDSRKADITNMLEAFGKTKNVTSSEVFAKQLDVSEEDLSPKQYHKLAKRTGELIAREHKDVLRGMTPSKLKKLDEESQADYYKGFDARLKKAVDSSRKAAARESKNW